MKPSEFRPNLEFYTVEGRLWRVTDVGTRTVTAIVIAERGEPVVPDPAWLAGPPYVVEEVLFNEKDLRSAYLDPHLGAIDRLREDRYHPGFSMAAVTLFDRATKTMRKLKPAYPHPLLLEHDRLGEHDILSPYGAVRNATDDGWDVQVYHVYAETSSTLPELEFLHRPLASQDALRALRDHHAQTGRPERNAGSAWV